MIVGFCGFQRSGKSATAMYLAREFERKFNMKIYTNMDTRGSCIEIKKLTDLPLDDQPKVLLWDEIHFAMDSRNIKGNIDFTPFISTLGKQKVLLLYTCPTPDLVDKRIRNFTSYLFLCKGDRNNIYLQLVDVLKELVSSQYVIRKTKDFFDYVNYNSDLVIPNQIKADISDFIEKVNNSRNIA